MAIRTISYTVDTFGVAPEKALCGGMQYEHNATDIEFKLSADFLSVLNNQADENSTLCYRIDFASLGGVLSQSENLELVGSTLCRSVPSSITNCGLAFTASLVISKVKSDNSTPLIIYSHPVTLGLIPVKKGSQSISGEQKNISALELLLRGEIDKLQAEITALSEQSGAEYAALQAQIDAVNSQIGQMGEALDSIIETQNAYIEGENV